MILLLQVYGYAENVSPDKDKEVVKPTVGSKPKQEQKKEVLLFKDAFIYYSPNCIL